MEKETIETKCEKCEKEIIAERCIDEYGFYRDRFFCEKCGWEKEL
jgi:hypothetical protein